MTALDSNIFIYILDKHPRFLEPARQALNEAVEDQAMISALVYAECLAKLRGKTFDKSKQLLDLLCEQGRIKVVQVDTQVAVLAAQLRASRKLRMVDALHVATALSAGATAMFSNDLELARLRLKGLAIKSL